MKRSWAYLNTDSRSWKPGVPGIPTGFSFLPPSPWDSWGAKFINVRDRLKGRLSLMLPFVFSWFQKWLKYELLWPFLIYIHICRRMMSWEYTGIIFSGCTLPPFIFISPLFPLPPPFFLCLPPISEPPLKVTSSLIAATTPDFWHRRNHSKAIP